MRSCTRIRWTSNAYSCSLLSIFRSNRTDNALQTNSHTFYKLQIKVKLFLIIWNYSAYFLTVVFFWYLSRTDLSSSMAWALVAFILTWSLLQMLFSKLNELLMREIFFKCYSSMQLRTNVRPPLSWISWQNSFLTASFDKVNMILAKVSSLKTFWLSIKL